MSRPRRIGLVLVGCLLACLPAGCGERSERSRLPARPQSIQIALPGPASALYGPLYSAQGEGDFAAAGLTVAPSPSSSGAAALERLAGGGADIAIASEPDLLAARERGQRLVSIGALTQGPLEALISLPPHAISAAPSLRGQRVATTGQPLQRAELATIIAAAGLPAGSAQETPAGNAPTTALPHRAAAALGGLGITDGAALELQRRRPVVLDIAALGVPAYTQLSLVVRQAQARTQGPVLRELLQALSRGAARQRTDAQPALATLLGADPRLDRGLALSVLQHAAPLLLPATGGRPFGYQNPVSWRAFGNWMLANHLLAQNPQAQVAVTNEFLPGQGE